MDIGGRLRLDGDGWRTAAAFRKPDTLLSKYRGIMIADTIN